MTKDVEIVKTSRDIIADTLLTELNEQGKVAILYTEDDLNLLVRALAYAMRYACSSNSTHHDQIQDMAIDVAKLQEAAFGKTKRKKRK